MQRIRWTFAMGLFLVAASAVRGQVVSGVASVTQSHMG
jgi:hypothetical protein